MLQGWDILKCAQKSKVVVLYKYQGYSLQLLLIDKPSNTACIPLYSVYEIANCNSNRYVKLCAIATEKISDE